MGSVSSIPPALLLRPTFILQGKKPDIFALASWEITTILTRWAGPFKCLFIHNFTCPVLWLNRTCITFNLMICAAQQYGIHCAYLYSAQKEEIYFCLKIYMGINMSSLQIGENTEPGISWRKKCIWSRTHKSAQAEVYHINTNNMTKYIQCIPFSAPLWSKKRKEKKQWTATEWYRPLNRMILFTHHTRTYTHAHAHALINSQV